MSVSALSFRICTSGLWSVATMSCEQPSMKYRVWCRAYATANASPSTGAYRLSAGVVNLLPTKHNFHPLLQQDGDSCLQAQYFCLRTKPMPSLDQSVARHVGRDASNNRTPSFIAWTIVFLDSSKVLLISSVHSNCADGFRRALKGFIVLAIAKAYAPWFTKPNQARAPDMSLGVGNFSIELRNFWLGLIFSLVTVSPANSTVSKAN